MTAVKSFARRAAGSVVALIRLTKLDRADVTTLAGIVLIGVGAGPAAAGLCLFYVGVLHPLLIVYLKSKRS